MQSTKYGLPATKLAEMNTCNSTRIFIECITFKESHRALSMISMYIAAKSYYTTSEINQVVQRWNVELGITRCSWVKLKGCKLVFENWCTKNCQWSSSVMYTAILAIHSPSIYLVRYHPSRYYLRIFCRNTHLGYTICCGFRNYHLTGCGTCNAWGKVRQMHSKTKIIR